MVTSQPATTSSQRHLLARCWVSVGRPNSSNRSSAIRQHSAERLLMLVMTQQQQALQQLISQPSSQC
jgi:hypothetical protein